MVASKNFLCSYLSSVQNITHHCVDEIIRGAFPSEEMTEVEVVTTRVRRLALSVDGSFSPENAYAGAGMILRNINDEVIFASCQLLFFCSDALEGEIHAIMGWISLALQWSTLHILVQSDSKRALSTMSNISLVKWPCHFVNEINSVAVRYC